MSSIILPQRIVNILLLLFLFSTPTLGQKRFAPKSKATLSDYINYFAINLHNTFRTNGNVIFSPWGAAISLGTMILGSTEDTNLEIKTTMYADKMSDDSIHDEFRRLRETLSRRFRGHKLDASTRLLVSKDVDLLENYKLQLLRYYDADTDITDFTKGGNALTFLVNMWTILKSNGHLPLMMKSAPHSDTKLLLLSASYFSVVWEHSFDKKETKLVQFRNLDGKKPHVDMMHGNRYTMVYTGKGLAVDAVVLPMKGDLTCMFIKPKDPTDMITLRKNFTGNFFEEIYRGLSKKTVELGIPKFKFNSKVELRDSLSFLGVKRLFSPTKAQLGKTSLDDGLFIDDIVHYAGMEISEKGSTLATANDLLSVIQPHSYKIVFDSPFMFLIRDTKSGLVIYMGRISNI